MSSSCSSCYLSAEEGEGDGPGDCSCGTCWLSDADETVNNFQMSMLSRPRAPSRPSPTQANRRAQKHFVKSSSSVAAEDNTNESAKFNIYNCTGPLPCPVYSFSEDLKLCHMTTFENLQCYFANAPDMASQTQLSAAVSIREHFTTLGEYLMYLYEHDHLTDVNISVGNQTFHAHSVALCCFSEYFADNLVSTNGEERKRDITIVDVSPKAFGAFLHYVYTGEVSSDPEIMLDYFKIARHLRATHLEAYLATMFENMSVEEIILAVVHLEHNTDNITYMSFLERIVENFTEATEVIVFLGICIELLMYLLSLDELMVESEYIVFSFVLRWVAQCSEERGSTHIMKMVFELIRFCHMSEHELRYCVVELDSLALKDELQGNILIAGWIVGTLQLGLEDPFNFPVMNPRHGYTQLYECQVQTSESSADAFIEQQDKQTRSLSPVYICEQSPPRQRNPVLVCQPSPPRQRSPVLVCQPAPPRQRSPVLVCQPAPPRQRSPVLVCQPAPPRQRSPVLVCQPSPPRQRNPVLVCQPAPPRQRSPMSVCQPASPRQRSPVLVCQPSPPRQRTQQCPALVCQRSPQPKPPSPVLVCQPAPPKQQSPMLVCQPAPPKQPSPVLVCQQAPPPKPPSPVQIRPPSPPRQSTQQSPVLVCQQLPPPEQISPVLVCQRSPPRAAGQASPPRQARPPTPVYMSERSPTQKRVTRVVMSSQQRSPLPNIKTRIVKSAEQKPINARPLYVRPIVKMKRNFVRKPGVNVIQQSPHPARQTSPLNSRKRSNQCQTSIHKFDNLKSVQNNAGKEKYKYSLGCQGGRKVSIHTDGDENCPSPSRFDDKSAWCEHDLQEYEERERSDSVNSSNSAKSGDEAPVVDTKVIRAPSVRHCEFHDPLEPGEEMWKDSSDSIKVVAPESVAEEKGTIEVSTQISAFLEQVRYEEDNKSVDSAQEENVVPAVVIEEIKAKQSSTQDSALLDPIKQEAQEPAIDESETKQTSTKVTAVMYQVKREGTPAPFVKDKQTMDISTQVSAMLGPVKQMSVKQESVKQKSVKQESVKQMSVKQESVKQKSVKQESVKQKKVTGSTHSSRQEEVKKVYVTEKKVNKEKLIQVDMKQLDIENKTPSDIYVAEANIPQEVVEFNGVYKKRKIKVDIYVIGGFKEVDDTNRAASKEGVPRKRTWIEFCNLPAPLCYYATVITYGKIYLLGGRHCQRNEPNEPQKTVYAMETTKRQWHKITDMNRARMKHCACVVGHMIYVFGGIGREKKLLVSCERFNARRNQWSMVHEMETARFGASAATVGTRCYVAGGFTDHALSTAVTLVEYYDTMTNGWVRVARLSGPRVYASMVNVCDRLFLCGGANYNKTLRDLQSTGAIDRYDVATDVWKQVATMRISRHGAGAAVAGRRIYVMGGASSPAGTMLGSVECYDTGADVWLRDGFQDLPYPAQWINCVTSSHIEERDSKGKKHRLPNL